MIIFGGGLVDAGEWCSENAILRKALQEEDDSKLRFIPFSILAVAETGPVFAIKLELELKTKHAVLPLLSPTRVLASFRILCSCFDLDFPRLEETELVALFNILGDPSCFLLALPGS